MSLLRLLTNSKVMAAEDLLTPESVWLALMTVPAARGSVWTDAWLAAFALTQRIKLVSFDSGMRRWAELQPEVLSRTSGVNRS